MRLIKCLVIFHFPIAISIVVAFFFLSLIISTTSIQSIRIFYSFVISYVRSIYWIPFEDAVPMECYSSANIWWKWRFCCYRSKEPIDMKINKIEKFIIKRHWHILLEVEILSLEHLKNCHGNVKCVSKFSVIHVWVSEFECVLVMISSFHLHLDGNGIQNDAFRW